MMSINTENISELNSYSPSFCAAKWTQVTIDLQHGMTHSCHHPVRHKIPEKELKKDVHALHDTVFKKKQRKKMLAGKRPKECSYCWAIEDADDGNVSDRYIKSFDPWSRPHLNEIATSDWKENYNPKYLEVFFSNICNLSCSYCMAHVSSSIEKEMDTFGPYPLKDRAMKKHRTYSAKKLKAGDENKYVEAFWQWLPKVYQDLHTLRLTGGEPLLDSNLDRLLDFMADNPHQGLTFAVNSNLCVGDSAIERFYSKLQKLKENTGINIELYTSLDTFGDQAEYIRAGLKYQKVLENMKRYQEMFPNNSITVMCCYNILSIPNFHHFLKDIAVLKKTGDVRLDISFLSAPAYLCAKWCSDELKLKVESDLDLMKELSYSQDEIGKLKRIFMLLKTLRSSTYSNEKRNFRLFIDEYDKRKKMSFNSIFPDFLRSELP